MQPAKPKKIKKYTLEVFLERSSQVHQNKYNYSKIKKDDIKGVKSLVPISCNLCKYKWSATIDAHINKKQGCARCQSGCISLKLFKEKALFLYGTKNNYSLVKKKHIDNQENLLPIKCNTCENIWTSTIAKHINKKSECPYCSPIGYSKVQIRWLEGIMKEENIVIQHALSPGGEHKIEGIGKVDGYCFATKTCYEFHGTMWHSDIRVYRPEDINPITKKTCREIYQKTIERDNKIRSLGYNLVTMWELDYKPK